MASKRRSFISLNHIRELHSVQLNLINRKQADFECHTFSRPLTHVSPCCLFH